MVPETWDSDTRLTQNLSYPFSKLLLFWAVREIAASNPVSSSGVIINYTNPGLCSTNLDRNAKLGMWLQINIGRLLMGRTAKMGSRTLLHGIAAEEATHGKYLSECETKE